MKGRWIRPKKKKKDSFMKAWFYAYICLHHAKNVPALWISTERMFAHVEYTG